MSTTRQATNTFIFNTHWFSDFDDAWLKTDGTAPIPWTLYTHRSAKNDAASCSAEDASPINLKIIPCNFSPVRR